MRCAASQRGYADGHARHSGAVQGAAQVPREQGPGAEEQAVFRVQRRRGWGGRRARWRPRGGA